MPKLKNCNFNRAVLVKYDIILNFIKIGGYLEDGPRIGPKGPELALNVKNWSQRPNIIPKTTKLFIIIELYC